jgi:GNAT superfamily N-acetyltransferase
MDRTTVGSLLRSTQAYCSELCEKETLEYGIAYYNPRFASLPEANQFREVLIEDPSRIPEAFEQTETWFRQRKMICRRWAPAGGQGTDELKDFLMRRGFRPRRHLAMSLARWVDRETPKDVRILPARAMRDAYRETFTRFETPGSSALRELLAEASLERLDDPHLDMVVALWDKQPVGRCGLYQVGDIARVMSVCVLPMYAGRGIEEALLAHVLALAKRLTMRTVLTQIDETDRAGLHPSDLPLQRSRALELTLEEAGFVCDGEIVEFERDPPTYVGIVP